MSAAKTRGCLFSGLRKLGIRTKRTSVLLSGNPQRFGSRIGGVDFEILREHSGYWKNPHSTEEMKLRAFAIRDRATETISRIT